MANEEWANLAIYAKKQGIKLQFDIFGERSLNLAVHVGVLEIKLHGTDIANIGLLKLIVNSAIERVLLGAGGANLEELLEAVTILQTKKVVILLGFQGYPTPVDANQISRIKILEKILTNKHPNLTIGFADHAPSDSLLRYALPALAVGAGAKVLEKHLTLSKLLKLEDYESALNPDEFLEFTELMHHCESANSLPNNAEQFDMSESENDYRKKIRRHVVANKDLEAGQKISDNEVVLKRTSSLNPINQITNVYGKVLAESVKKNMAIESL
jgi:N,N'-diacetyllegionaminate synthase